MPVIPVGSKDAFARGFAARNPQISTIGLAVFVLCIFAGVPFTVWLQNPLPMLISSLIGVYFLFAIRVAKQWEKAAVLRFGRYIKLSGPGPFLIVPIVDSISVYVDQRVRVS